MPTPLFPPDNGRIIIKQGPVGDCYLLAALDCIFSDNAHGYERIKSLFTPTRDGVEVRLKHTDQSLYLKKSRLIGKYEYQHDTIRNEDVFFLSADRLRSIDLSTDGVTTNSLAVKIIERLSAYYYKTAWDDRLAIGPGGLKRPGSVSAHNIEEKKKRYDSSSTTFVGKLLGIEAYDDIKINAIIELKQLFPGQPVYISMDYGVQDRFRKEHPRHALRVDAIVSDTKSSGGYRFELVNPWNNERHESYSLDDIKGKNCFFSIYRTNDAQFMILRALLDTPDLLSMVTQIRKLATSFSLQDLKYCVLLAKHLDRFPATFKALSLPDQNALVSYMSMLKSESSPVPDLEVVRLVSAKIEELARTAREKIIFEANTYISAVVQRIYNIPVIFTGLRSQAAIEMHTKTLLLRLKALPDNDLKLSQSEATLGTIPGSHHRRIVAAVAAKTIEIREKEKTEITAIKAAEAKVAATKRSVAQKGPAPSSTPHGLFPALVKPLVLTHKEQPIKLPRHFNR